MSSTFSDLSSVVGKLSAINTDISLSWPYSRSPVLSSTDEETDTSAEERPCFLCSFFKDSFDDVQDHIDTVRDRQNEIDFDPEEDGLDINNSTHTSKVTS